MHIVSKFEIQPNIVEIGWDIKDLEAVSHLDEHEKRYLKNYRFIDVASSNIKVELETEFQLHMAGHITFNFRVISVVGEIEVKPDYSEEFEFDPFYFDLSEFTIEIDREDIKEKIDITWVYIDPVKKIINFTVGD